MVSAANVQDVRLLFATINADTLMCEEIEAIVVVFTTIVMVMTAALPTGYRGKRWARNGYRPCDNQPREQKSLAGRKKDGKGKAAPCEMHSYLGRPTKHSWAECSENPTNQKKPAAKRAEAYYAHNKQRPASNATSLSNHRTVWASDKSSDKYSSCLDYSDDKDNFAVAISAAPCKQAKREALPPKKKLTIAMSELDNDINNNAASAKLGKLAALYATAPSWGRNAAVPRTLNETP
jgi:hypothetical protein